MKFGDFAKIKSLQTPQGFRDNLQQLGLAMPCDDTLESAPSSPLAAPLKIDGLNIGNRFAIQPMEGWDAETDGRPSDNTRRRWQRFGSSGAKLIWGGEAVAVRPDGRANPNQLMLNASTERDIGTMRESLIAAHREAMGSDDGLVIGLQLTHSGRFCKPNDHHKQEPMILYRHPILDRKFKLKPDHPIMSDGDIRKLIDDYVAVAMRAEALGFDFVDLKACHGYLGHEFLSAKTREGDFGGSLENRTRFLREIVVGVRAEAPRLKLGLRMSAIDSVSFRPDPALSGPERLGPGTPEEFTAPYRYGFGLDENNPLQIDLTETKAVIALARDLGIHLFNITLGSPYYTAPDAPCAVSALRRLPSAGGSADRRDAASQCGARTEAVIPRCRAGRQWLHLPAGIPAACRAGSGARGLDGFCRPRPHGTGLSRVAGRCAEREGHAAQAPVPHLQRLHHRAAAWAGVRLLSAGCALQEVAGDGEGDGN